VCESRKNTCTSPWVNLEYLENFARQDIYDDYAFYISLHK
jgi:hypothetical protein